MAAADLPTLADLVKNSPVVVYAAIGSVVFGYLASVSESLQKLLGPLGRRLAARQARRAERAASRTDVRILDLQGQLDHVVPRLDVVESELYEMRFLAAEHERWDWLVLAEARKTDPDFPTPPRLRPTKT